MSEEKSPSFNGHTIISGLAIAASVAALVFGFVNYTASLQNKFDTKTQMQQMDLLQKQVEQTQKTQHSEIMYLVHMANMQLLIGQDPIAALKTLQFALKQVPPTQVAASNLIGADILKLQTATTLNKDALFSDLAVLSQSITSLSSIPSAPVSSAAKPMVVDAMKKTWKESAINYIKSLKDLFIIRRTDETVSPILNEKVEFAIKQNMTLQLSLAQWALLHHDQKVYQTSLRSIANSLVHYFSLTDQTKSMLEKIAELEKNNIAPVLPSLDETLVMLSKMDLRQPAENPAPVARSSVVQPAVSVPAQSSQKPQPKLKKNKIAPIKRQSPGVEV